MIPSLQEGELRDDVLLRHVGSGHEKICASLGTLRTGCSRHGIVLEILHSPSQPATTYCRINADRGGGTGFDREAPIYRKQAKISVDMTGETVAR